MDQDKTLKGRFTKSDWVIFPLGLVVIICLSLVVMKAYALTYILTPSFYNAFWFPPFPSLLIALFGIVYIYKTVRRKLVGGIAKAIAYIILAVSAIFIFQVAMIIGGKGELCTNLYGVLTDCSEAHALTLYVFFANPYSLALISSIAVAGGIVLLVKSESTDHSK
jgi:hypothetical protein